VSETDYTGAPSTHLYFVRHYNSYDSSTAGFGVGWHSTYHRGLAVVGSTVTVTLATGKTEAFTQNMSGQYVGPANVPDVLTVYPSSGTQTGWQFVTAPDDNVELYTLAGQLTSITTRAGLTTSLSYTSGNLTTVTGPLGQTLTFTYNSAGNVATMTDPASNVFHYGYDAADNLAYVEYPDSTYRWYQFTGGYPDIITAIIDENGYAWASWGYDSYGRATSSQLAGGVNATTLSYTATGTTAVTDANGNSHTYTYQANQALIVTTSLSGQPYPPAGGQAFTYDSNGYVASITDFNGNVTALTHDSRGDETTRTEAYGTGIARTTTTTWSGTWHLPTQIAEPLRTTTLGYDAYGNLTSKSVTDGTHTRTWQWSYNASGLPLTTTDPDGNGTVLAYSTTGYLASITNALGQTTSYTSYDANGRLLTMTDPNSLSTTFTYDKRGRTLTRTVGTEETKWAYDYVGNLTKLTFPDSSYLTYSYDAAHRLTAIQDVAGDSIAYGYDANSNVTSVSVYNPSSTLERTHSYAYDTVNRLASESGAYSGETTYYNHDANGNLIGITNPLSAVTTNYYDALNRLTETIDPLGNTTTRSYDAQDDLTGVTDGRGLTTSYSYDGLGDQTQVSSPDAGTTVVTYDAAGNVLTSTDALSQTTTYQYDGLNRTTTVAYAGSGSIGYLYDSGTYGIGHLAKITDLAATTSYTYDQHGRELTMKQTTGSVALTVTYAYDSYGRLHTLENPSTKTMTYSYDTSGRISGISPGASSISYFPFGMATGWTENNGAVYSRALDQDGRVYWDALGSSTTPALTNQQTLTYDVNSRITELQETGLNTKYYGYDNLDRLTSYFDGTTTNGYNYDADGNRTYTTAAAGTTTYSTSGSSNWLTGLSGVLSATNTYNADGNLTGDGTFTYGYDGRGRMALASTGTSTTTNYGVNAPGQRVLKSGSGVGNGGTNEYVYDQFGNFLGEYGSTGTNIDETVWLPNTPVAALSGGYGMATPVAVLTGSTGTTVSSLSADWLGAPHIIQNSSKVSEWTWDHAAFGDGIPNNNPNGLGAFTYNLGFPGQHYDAETATYYNYFRDAYNQQTGRYFQADPLGLRGGQASLYPYVGGNPLTYIDPDGSLVSTTGWPQPGKIYNCFEAFLLSVTFGGDPSGSVSAESICQNSSPPILTPYPGGPFGTIWGFNNNWTQGKSHNGPLPPELTPQSPPTIWQKLFPWFCAGTSVVVVIVIF
jgi:RHS repeat-associated protein